MSIDPEFARKGQKIILIDEKYCAYVTLVRLISAGLFHRMI
jgi:hypothetical protein